MAGVALLNHPFVRLDVRQADGVSTAGHGLDALDANAHAKYVLNFLHRREPIQHLQNQICLCVEFVSG